MTDKDFDVLRSLFTNLVDLEREIEYNEYADSSIIIGCDCGCGGDTIDWGKAKADYHDLLLERADLEKEIKSKLMEVTNAALPA